MNLFEANRVLSVKLGQSFESLYRLPFFEYSIYKKMVTTELAATDGSTSTLSQEQFEVERARPTSAPSNDFD